MWYLGGCDIHEQTETLSKWCDYTTGCDFVRRTNVMLTEFLELEEATACHNNKREANLILNMAQQSYVHK